MAKILIVEDNALNIKLFCDLLAAHGHEPEAVTDSRNALDAARSFSPDLVITDIQLPHVSGLELIRDDPRRRRALASADHGSDRLFGARGRGADPRCWSTGLCVQADLGDAVRADGRRIAAARRESPVETGTMSDAPLKTAKPESLEMREDPDQTTGMTGRGESA